MTQTIVQPVAFTWPYAVVFSLVGLWVFLPEIRLTQRDRASAARAGSTDRGSMAVIIIGNQIALLVAVAISGWTTTILPVGWRVPCFWAGLLMLISGSLLRRHCWRILGEYFTGDVKVREAQPVIDRGAYRWVRHPSYTGGMLMFTGIGLALANWLSLVLMVATTLAVYVYRVRVEERTLLAALGEPYRRFMNTRARFIPFVI
jgi:protein-S-isoprenylcysteine O-methyltransferase Ste14